MGYYTCEDCDRDVPGVHESTHWDGVGGIMKMLAHRAPEICAPCTEIRELKRRIRRAINISSSGGYQGNGPVDPIVQEMVAALQGDP